MNHLATKHTFIPGLLRLSLLALLLTVALVQSASADTIYAYTGTPMSSVVGTCPAPCTITGIMTFSTPLPANDTLVLTGWMGGFTDGLQSLSFTDGYGFPLSWFPGFLPVLFDMEFSTDNLGNITAWNVDVWASSDNYEIYTSSQMQSGRPLACDDAYGYDMTCRLFANQWVAASTGGPGSWTVETPVPEPSSLILFGTGLVALLGAARRKWQR
jgi:hypothetical protein